MDAVCYNEIRRMIHILSGGLILEKWLVFTLFFIKEHFIYRDFEQPGNPECEFEGRIIFFFFNSEDRLARYPELVSKCFLGKVTQCPVNFNPVFHFWCDKVVISFFRFELWKAS